MIGDELYETVRRRREGREEAQRRSRPPAPPRPEGVTIYECRVAAEGPEYAELAPEDVPQCGRIEERKPYEPVPWHCQQPMAIRGYDWERDVEAKA